MCTPEHPFYVVERTTKHSNNVSWSEPNWVQAKDLTSHHYVVTAKQQEEFPLDISEDEAFLFGLYLADGWIERGLKPSGCPTYGITFARPLNERQHFIDLMSRSPYRGPLTYKKSIAVSWDYHT